MIKSAFSQTLGMVVGVVNSVGRLIINDKAKAEVIEALDIKLDGNIIVNHKPETSKPETSKPETSKAKRRKKKDVIEPDMNTDNEKGI